MIFRVFLFTDEIYVFTPKGELRNLPLHSSVLDFAYAIHSEIGNSCIGAKVNHNLAPLDQKLKSGDQVEILTSKKQIPKEEWFNYVVTARARTQIKQGIKEEKRKFTEQGKQRLQEYFNEIEADFSNKNQRQLQQKYNYASPIDLYYDVAKGLLGLKEIKECCGENPKESWLSKMIRIPFIRSRNQEKKTLTETVVDVINQRKDITINSEDIQKISYDISACCKPIPGDDIVGFIEPDETIRIHRTTCPVAVNQMSKYGNKIIKTQWTDKESIGFIAGIEIHGIDTKGFIKDIIQVITEELNVNIKSFHLDTQGGMTTGIINVYVYSVGNLNNLISELKKVPNVKKAHRLSSAASK